LYTVAILLVGGHFLFRRRLRYPAPGTIAGAGLAVAGLSRLVTEPMRVSIFGGPVGWYAAALIGGATVAIWAATRPRPEAAEDG
jgi:prolipoprotein diacylglyceryltransferase